MEDANVREGPDRPMAVTRLLEMPTRLQSLKRRLTGQAEHELFVKRAARSAGADTPTEHHVFKKGKVGDLPDLLVGGDQLLCGHGGRRVLARPGIKRICTRWALFCLRKRRHLY